MEAGFLKSLPEKLFREELISKAGTAETDFLNAVYIADPATEKRYLKPVSQNNLNRIREISLVTGFDNRWVSLYQKSVCTPYLIIQQRGEVFYENPMVHSLLKSENSFPDTNSGRSTYLLELKLLTALYDEDVALYRIVNTPKEVINLIPFLEVDEEIYDYSEHDFFCLQSAPSDLNPGRMLSEANIEGLMDQYTPFKDRIGGNYQLQGLRYLIKGYFRFGSSGSPYLRFNKEKNKFLANAVQSEACPIQLTINNDRTGNFQYINAIATPLAIVMERLREHLV
jgi:hypothetical protein